MLVGQLSDERLLHFYIFITRKRAPLKLREIFGQGNARVFVNNTTMTKKFFFSVDLSGKLELYWSNNQRDLIGLGQSTA